METVKFPFLKTLEPWFSRRTTRFSGLALVKFRMYSRASLLFRADNAQFHMGLKSLDLYSPTRTRKVVSMYANVCLTPLNLSLLGASLITGLESSLHYIIVHLSHPQLIHQSFLYCGSTFTASESKSLFTAFIGTLNHLFHGFYQQKIFTNHFVSSNSFNILIYQF